MSDKQRISLDPANPVQGGQVKIDYDFSGLGATQVTLRVTFTTGEGEASAEHVVTTSNPSVTVSVPEDAISILVEDLSGNSPDCGAVVEPP